MTTDVRCPACHEGQLAGRFSCRQVGFGCTACGARFSLEALAPVLDDEAFDRLAEQVASRFCDRV